MPPKSFSAGDATQEQTAQELFLEDMTCVLTREYVTLMPSILATETIESNENGQNEDCKSFYSLRMIDEMHVDIAAQEKKKKTMTLTALGVLLINDDVRLIEGMMLFNCY